MKRLCLAALVLLVLVGVWLAIATRENDAPGSAPTGVGEPSGATLLARGEYLTRAADCAACHTTHDGRPFAGGVAFKLPFGTIYSSNITSDLETGIGRWSEAEFERALHEGIRKDGARLYPAFPYTSYTALSRGDISAIRTYLMSLAAVRQPNRENELRFPFNQRLLMTFWDAVFFKSKRFESEPERSVDWNRGAYLATALGHCGECHTPRNMGFATKRGQEFAGSVVDGWRAPNITPDRAHGVGTWSEASLAEYLTTGHADGHGSAGGPMGEAVEKSLQYLSPEDATALVAYLRSRPAQVGKEPIEVNPRPSEALLSTAAAPATSSGPQNALGRRVFAWSCASCHAWNGQGRETPYASLVGARSVNDAKGTNVVKMILQGAHENIHGSDVMMPSFSTYSDVEIAAMANYVVSQFGGKNGQVTADAVHQQRDSK
jgi:mono/diheme cytochrome c family protein